MERKSIRRRKHGAVSGYAFPQEMDQKFRSYILANDDRNERHHGINWPQAFELGIVDSYLTNLTYFSFL